MSISVYIAVLILNYFMQKEIEILNIMKELRCDWEEAVRRLNERKKLTDFF